MLSGFQEAAQKIQDKDEYALAPFYLFYDTVHTFLDSSIRRVIERCQKAADNGPALKSCRIWQLGPSAPAAMRFIGLDRMSGEYGGPDLTRYQAVFDGTVSTNSLDGIWEAFCRRSLGSDGQPLAISDLVELYDDSGSEFYYVDRTAIVPVQLKAPEQESGMTMTL